DGLADLFAQAPLISRENIANLERMDAAAKDFFALMRVGAGSILGPLASLYDWLKDIGQLAIFKTLGSGQGLFDGLKDFDLTAPIESVNRLAEAFERGGKASAAIEKKRQADRDFANWKKKLSSKKNKPLDDDPDAADQKKK